MGRTPAKTRRTSLANFSAVNRGAIRYNAIRHGATLCFSATLCLCAMIALTGCSKIGSQNALSHRGLPFSNSARAADQQAGYTTRDAVKLADRTPTNPVREEIRTVSARPPKLSALPELAIYAEPVVTQAAQVSFEEDIKETENSANELTIVKVDTSNFNPAAEPPAQIFEQSVAPPQARIASSRTLAPMLFKEGSRKKNPNFNGTLRDPKFAVIPPKPMPRVERVTEPREEPLMVVDDTDPVAPILAGKKVDFSNSSIEPQTKIAPFLLTPKVADELTVEDSPTVPQTDPSAFDGQWETYQASELTTYADSQPSQSSQPSQPIESIDLMADSQLPVVDAELANRTPLEQPLVATVVESDVELESSMTSLKMSSIKVDSNFAPEVFDDEPVGTAVTMATTKMAAAPAPAPFVLSPPIPEVVITPAIEILEPTWVEPEVEPKNALVDSDFLPVFGPSKNDLSEDAPFSQSLPSFGAGDAGDSAEPLAIVEREAFDGPALIRKDIETADFSPVDLPMPQQDAPSIQSIQASFDASEDRFRLAGFEGGEPKQVVAADIPPVGVEALMKLNAVTWQSRLAQTVDLVNDQLNEQGVDSETRTSLEVNLRLLDVLSRQMNDIVENQQQFSQSENQYWQDQLEAITSMLKVADPLSADGGLRANEMLKHRTAHETLSHLRKAVAHLESLANLRVVSGAFCTEVSGYGQFRLFERDVFPAGQQVLVYCEIENFMSTQNTSETGDSFHTRLRGSYAIYDSSGRAVQQAEFPVLEDIARKRRRDFYMHLPITIGALDSGNYELHLLVEDLGGNKTASLTPPLMFSVTGQLADRQARR